MRVLVLAQSPVAGDARVLKQARTLLDAGHDVTVIGRGVPLGAPELSGLRVLDAGRSAGLGSAGRASRASGARADGRPSSGAGLVGRIRRRGVRAARWLLLPEHRALVETRWRRAARDLALEAVGSADGRPAGFEVVHAHDLNTLDLAADLASRWGVPYVYDAHELWSDRGLPGRPTPVRVRRWTRRETALAAGARAVVTVSDGIAEELRDRGIGHVVVVRNSFPARTSSTTLPVTPDALVYAGRIGPGRDLDTLLEASRDPRVPGVLLVGPTDDDFVSDLVVPASAERRPAAATDEVDELYRRHGAAAITLARGPRNHALALPNKLFHAVRAGVPVVAADLPELGRIVRRHDLGELYRPGDVDSLAAACRRLVDRYADLLASVAAARDELSWDRDARVLVDVYAGLEEPGR